MGRRVGMFEFRFFFCIRLNDVADFENFETLLYRHLEKGEA